MSDPRLWGRFRLDHSDRRDAEGWVRRLTDADLDVIAQASQKVLALPGSRLGPAEPEFFSFLRESPRRPPGLLALMCLVACAPEVIAFGIAQGFDTDVAASGLGDLGHQVRVHRNTTGAFGLSTQWRLTLPWNGSMWWFGRLQYHLLRREDGYWLSVRIPGGGPLSGVEESFTAARFFARTSLEVFRVRGFHLDPYLTASLEPGTTDLGGARVSPTGLIPWAGSEGGDEVGAEGQHDGTDHEQIPQDRDDPSVADDP